VLVMYAGRIVESGSKVEVFGDPQHPRRCRRSRRSRPCRAWSGRRL